MKDGEIQKRKSTLAVDQGDDEHTCYQGELLVARNAGELLATGGPCPIVVFYHHDSRKAAIMHISGEDAEPGGGGDGYVEMMALLDDVDSDFPREARCIICLDRVPAIGFIPEEDEADQESARMAYAESAREYFMEEGFAAVEILSDGQEKAIHLDSSAGKLVVVDEDDGELLTIDF